MEERRRRYLASLNEHVERRKFVYAYNYAQAPEALIDAIYDLLTQTTECEGQEAAEAAPPQTE